MKVIQLKNRSRTLQVIASWYALTCMLCQVLAYSSFTTRTSQFNNHAFSTPSMRQSILSNIGQQHQPRLSSSRGIMTMKQRLNAKQRKIRAKEIIKKTPEAGGGEGIDSELPQNLRRKVVAKRPFLGHVVPKNAQKSGAGGSSSPKLRPQGKARAAGLNNPSNLKILGGTARGRRLDSPEVYLRPMMGKVREAVYSTFTSFGLYEEGIATRHLDIFSGSGSVGLESLSRGAAHCTFVDLAQDCCNAVHRNIEWCEFDDDDEKTRVICAEAIETLRNPFNVGIPVGSSYNLVTLCPPYEEISYFDLIDAVANSPVVTDDTVILVEYPVELGCLPHVITREDGGALVGVRNRKYGRTVIALYVVNPSGKLNGAESRPEEFVSF